MSLKLLSHFTAFGNLSSKMSIIENDNNPPDVIKVFLSDEETNELKPMILKAVSEISDTTNTHRFMSDCHPCHGTTFVGWTFKLNDIYTIKPTYIGPDIGCGILVIPLTKKLNEKKLIKLVEYIKGFFPMGDVTMHNKSIVDDSYIDRYMEEIQNMTDDFTVKHNLENHKQSLDNLCKRLKVNVNNIKRTIGTLGGGNHYIEINEDDDGNMYLSIHSGSRSLGHHIMVHYTKLSDDKGYIRNDVAKEYIFDLILSQVFAKMNRHTIAKVIMDYINDNINISDSIESFHNFIEIDTGLLRKGAISAKLNEKCIVSLNMKEGILLCNGLGNSDSNYSCAHGCGRNYSRGSVDKSNKQLKEFEKVMKDVISVDINKETLDEAPFAYKNSDMIIDSIKDNVVIIKKMKAIMNVKG